MRNILTKSTHTVIAPEPGNHPVSGRHLLSVLPSSPGRIRILAEPDVPSENNAAERSLRHLVTSRKISGGTRSTQGTNTKMALASLFGTWRARGLNPLTACRQLLTSPQL